MFRNFNALFGLFFILGIQGFSVASFGQVSVQEFLDRVSVQFQRNPEGASARSNEAVELATMLFKQRGERFKVIAYPYGERMEKAIEIQGDALAPLGTLSKIAYELSREIKNIRVLYFPYSLIFGGADAVFSSRTNVLGISHYMAGTGQVDSSFLHERFHARTSEKRYRGTSSVYHGYAQLVKGERMSTKSEYYYHLMSFEEVVGMSISLVESAKLAIQLYESRSQRVTRNDEELEEEALGEAYFSADVGMALAKQWMDFSEKMNEVVQTQFTKIQWEWVNHPVEQKKILQSVISIPSYERVYRQGRGSFESISEGTEVFMQWVNPEEEALYVSKKWPKIAELFEKRFTLGNSVSLELIPQLKQCQSFIGWMIERADVSRTQWVELKNCVRVLEEKLGRLQNI